MPTFTSVLYVSECVCVCLQFMRELCAVWKWSVEERRGLFSQDHTPSFGKTDEKRTSIQTRQHTLIIEVTNLCNVKNFRLQIFDSDLVWCVVCVLSS